MIVAVIPQKISEMVLSSTEVCRSNFYTYLFYIAVHNTWFYRGADKSLVRPERKQAAPVKSMMDRGMDWFG